MASSSLCEVRGRETAYLVKREAYLASQNDHRLRTTRYERRTVPARHASGNGFWPFVIASAYFITAVCLRVKIPTPLVTFTCPVRFKRDTS